MPVKNGDKIIDTINKIQKNFQYVVLTQDWHLKDPFFFFFNNPDKKIFSTKKMYYGEQVIWPPHCIIGTKGAGVS